MTLLIRKLDWTYSKKNASLLHYRRTYDGSARTTQFLDDLRNRRRYWELKKLETEKCGNDTLSHEHEGIKVRKFVKQDKPENTISITILIKVGIEIQTRE